MATPLTEKECAKDSYNTSHSKAKVQIAQQCSAISATAELL